MADIANVGQSDGVEEVACRLETFDAVEVEADPFGGVVSVGTSGPGLVDELPVEKTFEKASSICCMIFDGGEERGEVLDVMSLRSEFVNEGIGVFDQITSGIKLVDFLDGFIGRQKRNFHNRKRTSGVRIMWSS